MGLFILKLLPDLVTLGDRAILLCFGLNRTMIVEIHVRLVRKKRYLAISLWASRAEKKPAI